MTLPARILELTLTDFRSHAEATLTLGEGVVVLAGPNGAGKTNVLEAVSMLAPGRGLRGASLSEMVRTGGAGGWAVAARAAGVGGEAALGTGVSPQAPERRAARVNGAPAPVSQFGERLAVSWLTPSMDRLLAEGASARRRFLDRLTLALEPGHGAHATRYEAALRERTRLLAGEAGEPDARWLDALEARIAEHGSVVARARARAVAALKPHLAAVSAPFPAAAARYADSSLGAGQDEWRKRRSADAAAGRATFGPHRADLEVSMAATGVPAARCSTGEQKALLIAIVLAHAELTAEARGLRPILLLDEVAAHLDPDRRAALFERLPCAGQCWLTGADPALFAGVRTDSRFMVGQGAVRRAD